MQYQDEKRPIRWPQPHRFPMPSCLRSGQVRRRLRIRRTNSTPYTEQKEHSSTASFSNWFAETKATADNMGATISTYPPLDPECRGKALKSLSIPQFLTTLRKGSDPQSHGDPIQLLEDTEYDRRRVANGQEFDITLVVKGHHFRAHKWVLSERSRYFEPMFSFFNEQNLETVELKELVEPVAFARSLYFLYFGQIRIEPHTVQELLSLANYLQIDSLLRTCSDYIAARIDKNNCIPLFMYTLAMGPADLLQVTEDFILANFEKITNKRTSSNDLANLPEDIFLRIISSDCLTVSSESVVYKAVLKWVAHDPKERSDSLSDLLEHVHFPLMSLDELEQHCRSARAKKIGNLSNALEEAKDYFSKDAPGKTDFWKGRQKPARWPKIFVVMRMYWKNLPIEYYDFQTRTWSVLCTVDNWRSCAAMVAYQSNIYLLGGEETDKKSPTGSRTVNRVTRYDCEAEKWVAAQSMSLARRWAAAVVLGSTLYVIGKSILRLTDILIH